MDSIRAVSGDGSSGGCHIKGGGMPRDDRNNFKEQDEAGRENAQNDPAGFH